MPRSDVSTLVGNDSSVQETLNALRLRCTNAANSLQTASAWIEAAKQAMIARKDASISAMSVAACQLKEAIDSSAAAAVAQVESSCKARVKALDAQLDELMVSAAQLSCTAEMISANLRGSTEKCNHEQLIDSANATLKLERTLDLPSVSTCVEAVCALENMLEQVKSFASVRQRVDAPGTTVERADGRGGFNITHESGSELVLKLKAKDCNGTVVQSVTPDDVLFESGDAAWDVVVAGPESVPHVQATAQTAAVTEPRPASSNKAIHVANVRVVDGSLYFTLTTPSTITTRSESVAIKMYVCGASAVPIAVRVTSGAASSGVNQFDAHGKLIRVINTKHGQSYGLAVSADESLLVISEYSVSTLKVYNAETGAMSKSFRSVNGMLLRDPIKTIFTPGGNLLIADKGNNRVIEVTTAGDYIRAFYTSTPRCVAISPDNTVLAVGNSAGTHAVVLFSFETCKELRQIVLRKDADYGQLEGVRFSHDGTQLYMIFYSGKKVVCCNVDDGSIVGSYGDGKVGDGIQLDVELTANGDIVAVDNHRGILRVFDQATGGEARSWTIEPADGNKLAGRYRYLTGMAVVGSRLYVLDNTSDSHAVYVYE